MVTAYFENIRAKILEALEQAQTSVYVAVYWFTNQELFDKLLEKLSSNVDVRLIIHNDYINNRETGLPFQTLISKGCKFYFSGDENPMHNKFCLIDGQVLINGSYNWTYYAENKNRENVLIITDEQQVISAFVDEFNRLVTLLTPQEVIRPLTKFEIDENNLLRSQDYLAHDIVYQAKATNKPEIVQQAFEIAPANLSVQKIANDLNLIKKFRMKHSLGVSLVNDEVKWIAKKGDAIPATFFEIVRTNKDNQPISEVDIIYGESDRASANSKLTKMTLTGLPLKPKGKAEVKFTFSIDMDGNMKIEEMSLDDGKKENWQHQAKWLIEGY
jgi:hypothetical protein